MSDPKPRTGDLAGTRFVLGCAHREVNDRDPALADIPRIPVDEQTQQRFDEGLEFEEMVFAELCRIHKVRNLRDADDTETATLAAMNRGERIVIGPSLPVVNHRGGRPDVLLRHGTEPMANGKWAYVPVDVKNSKPLEGSAKPRDWQVSTLAEPWFESSAPTDLGKGGPKEDHSLQLAHYWLMLVDLGHAPAIPPIGGTINPGLGVVWRDLDDAKKSFVALAVQEWDRRWTAINAMRDGHDRLTRPFLHSNCDQCHWRDFCEDIVVRENHVSLVSGVGEAAVRDLAAVGIHLVPELAACDPSADDVNGLKLNSRLRKAIDAARVLESGSDVPFSLRGEDLVAVPRADVEIDFDIENDDIVYLYGCHVSHRTGPNSWSEGEFTSFHSFDRTDPDTEARLLVEFWTWLHGLVASTHADGKTLAVYCYSGDFAEIPRMKEASLRHPDFPGMPSIEMIAGLADQDWWVDMNKVVNRYLWPTRKLGLKYVAPLAGFEWDADDASGSNSILWYRAASDPGHPDRDALAAKLLRYNADDVKATQLLRWWLNDGVESRGWSIEPVEILDSRY